MNDVHMPIRSSKNDRTSLPGTGQAGFCSADLLQVGRNIAWDRWKAVPQSRSVRDHTPVDGINSGCRLTLPGFRRFLASRSAKCATSR